MDELEMTLHSGPTPTSVSVRIKNSSPGTLSIAAPNLYYSLWVTDGSGELFPRIRVFKCAHSPKSALLQPRRRDPRHDRPPSLLP